MRCAAKVKGEVRVAGALRCFKAKAVPAKAASVPEQSVADALPGLVDDIYGYSAAKAFAVRWLVAKRAITLPAVAAGIAAAAMPPAASAIHWATFVCATALLQRLSIRGLQRRVSADLSGQSCLVTGGTEGIGLALVVRLLDLGADVIVLSRASAHKEDATRALIAAAAVKKAEALDRLIFVTCDLSDPQQVTAAAATLRKDRYSLDLVVNNAASFSDLSATAKRCPQLEQHVASNFVGPFALTEALLPLARASSRGGRVVYVTCGLHSNVRSGNVLTSRLSARPDANSPLNISTACYGAAKLACLYHVKTLSEKRIEVVSRPTKPLIACSVDPGYLISSQFFEKGSEPFLGRGSFGNALRAFFRKTPDEAATAVLDACVRNDVVNGGHYLECTFMPSALSRQAHNERQRAEVMQWASQKAKVLGFLATK